jgi:hypothetical protein
MLRDQPLDPLLARIPEWNLEQLRMIQLWKSTIDFQWPEEGEELEGRVFQFPATCSLPSVIFHVTIGRPI